MKYTFNPNYKLLCRLQGQYSIADLEKEVGVYSATPDFIRKHCGKIANNILESIPGWYYDEAEKLGLFPNCDVRIHRLYPGDFPAYPGWHCDGEFRETYFSQPDLDRIKVHKHIICTVSSHEGGVSNCRFLKQPFELQTVQPTQDHTLWGQLDKAISEQSRNDFFDSSDGEMILFDSWTPHKVMPAKIRGWRLFFRMSMWHKPNLGDGGMISKQEQVYKLVEGSGW